MTRKIYIGATYRTKFGTEFTVTSIEKGKKNKHFKDRRRRTVRRAVDKNGETILITSLTEEIKEHLNNKT